MSCEMASCVSQLELQSYANSVNQRRNLSHSDFMTSTSPASLNIFTNVKLDSSPSQEVYKDSVSIDGKMDNTETTEAVTTAEIGSSSSSTSAPNLSTKHKNRRKRSTSEDNEEPKLKSRRKIFRLETLPGTSLKICKNCGTVAETAKSKKCQNCQKFFYEHWAQRCRIPPCPKCHFSRRSRAREKPPFKCDRCGHLLTVQALSEELSSGGNELGIADTITDETGPTLDTDECGSSQLIPTVLNILKICGNQCTPSSTLTDEPDEEDESERASSLHDTSISSENLPTDVNISPLSTSTKQSSDEIQADVSIEFPDPPTSPQPSLSTTKEGEESFCESSKVRDPPNTLASSHVEAAPVTSPLSGLIRPHHTPSIVTMTSSNKASIPHTKSEEGPSKSRSPPPLVPISTLASLYPLSTSESSSSVSHAVSLPPTISSAIKETLSVPSDLFETMNSLFTISSVAANNKKHHQNAIGSDSEAVSTGLSVTSPPSVADVVMAASPSSSKTNELVSTPGSLPIQNFDKLPEWNEDLLSHKLVPSTSVMTPMLPQPLPLPVSFALSTASSMTGDVNYSTFEKHSSSPSNTPVADFLPTLPATLSTPVIVPAAPLLPVTTASNSPSLYRIKELVELTLKQNSVAQFQPLARKQRKVLVDQLQAQIQIQRDLLKSRAVGEPSESLEKSAPLKTRKRQLPAEDSAVKRLKSDSVPSASQQAVPEVLPIARKGLDKVQSSDMSLSDSAHSLKLSSEHSDSFAEALLPSHNTGTEETSKEGPSAVLQMPKVINQSSLSASGSSKSTSSLPVTSIPQISSTRVLSSPPPPDASLQSSFARIDVNSMPFGHDNIRVSLLKHSPTVSPAQPASLHSDESKMNRVVFSSLKCSPTTVAVIKSDPVCKPLAKSCGSDKSSPIVIDDVDEATGNDFVPSLSPIEEEPSGGESCDLIPFSCSVGGSVETPSATTQVQALSKPIVSDLSPVLSRSGAPVSTLPLSRSVPRAPAVGKAENVFGTDSASTSVQAAGEEIRALPLSSLYVNSTAMFQASAAPLPPVISHHDNTSPTSSMCIPSLLRPASGTAMSVIMSPPLKHFPAIPSLLRPLPVESPETIRSDTSSTSQKSGFPAVNLATATSLVTSSSTIDSPVIITRPALESTAMTSPVTSVLPIDTRPPTELGPEPVASTSDPPRPPTTVSDSSGMAKPPGRGGGLVTVQVCNSFPSTLSSEALKISTSGSYRPAIIRPRPTAAIGGVLIQSLEPRSPDESPLPRGGGVFVSVLGRSIPSIEVKGQDKSLGTGGVSCKSPTNTPAESSRPHKKSGQGSNSGNGRKKSGGGQASGGGGGVDDDGDSYGGRKDEAGDGKELKKRKKPLKSSSSKKNQEDMKLFSVKLKDGFFHHLLWDKQRMVFIVPLANGEVKSSVVGDESQNGSVKGEGSSGKGSRSAPIVGKDRKTRRKAKLEPMVMHEVEDEIDPLLESPSTSSAHISASCFSIYELKNKVLSDLPPNTIYAFTYRHHLKTVKPPLHWHQVLKRMGGVQSSSHTCRLLELRHIQRMVDHYAPDSSLPSCLDDFSKNKLPKGRQVIDLSDIDPDDLLNSAELLEEIPQCSTATPRKKKTSSTKSSPKVELNESVDSSKPDESPDDEEKSHDDPVFPEEEGGDEKEAALKSDEVLPPTSKSKKKYCPQCGVQIARKSKKCYECGKIFGVFSFGRRLCPACGHCNLARMLKCFRCDCDLADAPRAIPEVFDDKGNRDTFPVVRTNKRLREELHDDESKPTTKVRREHYFSFSSSAPSSRLPSTADTEFSMDDFPVEGGVVSDQTVKSEEPTTPTRQMPGYKSSKFSGYQYGRIPWGDADVTCLVDETGTPKFCLPELCSKVLRGHAKSDILDIVKDLHLPLAQGDFSLLKKLQALGLHSNRSPMCRLIGPDELWTLLDALQERVPAEVHQHLETITMSTTPLLLSPVVGGASTQSPALIPACTTIPEDEEHGFESTLHEVECSDGQRIALLRTWNGEQYGSLTEIWRKYFPEVNRNHLTSVLKRLKLDTNMPTGQQATLLRNANVISVRGAAGRMMKLEDMQMLLDELSIPLQIGSSPSIKVPPTAPPVQPPVPPPPVSRQRKNSSFSLSYSNMPSRGATQGKVLATKEDLQYAECMRNLLQVIDLSRIKQLLEDSREKATDSTAAVDSESKAASLELDDVQQRISSRRELCNVITDEIGFLNVTNHGFMAEVVRLSNTEKMVFSDLNRLCKMCNLCLK